MKNYKRLTAEKQKIYTQRLYFCFDQKPPFNFKKRKFERKKTFSQQQKQQQKKNLMDANSNNIYQNPFISSTSYSCFKSKSNKTKENNRQRTRSPFYLKILHISLDSFNPKY